MLVDDCRNKCERSYIPQPVVTTPNEFNTGRKNYDIQIIYYNLYQYANEMTPLSSSLFPSTC